MPYTRLDYELITQAKDLISGASFPVAKSFIDNLPDNLKVAKEYFSNLLQYLQLRTQFEGNQTAINKLRKATLTPDEKKQLKTLEEENKALGEQLKKQELEKKLKATFQTTDNDPDRDLKMYLELYFNRTGYFDRKSGELNFTGTAKRDSERDKTLLEKLGSYQPKVFMAMEEQLFNEDPSNEKNNALIAASGNLPLQVNLSIKLLTDYTSGTSDKVLKRTYGITREQAIGFLQRGVENGLPHALYYAQDRTTEYLKSAPSLYDIKYAAHLKTNVRRIGEVALALCQDKELKSKMETSMLLDRKKNLTETQKMKEAKDIRDDSLKQTESHYNAVALTTQLAARLPKHVKEQIDFNNVTEALTKRLEEQIKKYDSKDPEAKPLKDALSDITIIRRSTHIPFRHKVLLLNETVKNLEKATEKFETANPLKRLVNWFRSIFGKVKTNVITKEAKDVVSLLKTKEEAMEKSTKELASLVTRYANRVRTNSISYSDAIKEIKSSREYLGASQEERDAIIDKNFVSLKAKIAKEIQDQNGGERREKYLNEAAKLNKELASSITALDGRIAVLSAVTGKDKLRGTILQGVELNDQRDTLKKYQEALKKDKESLDKLIESKDYLSPNVFEQKYSELVNSIHKNYREMTKAISDTKTSSEMGEKFMKESLASLAKVTLYSHLPEPETKVLEATASTEAEKAKVTEEFDKAASDRMAFYDETVKKNKEMENKQEEEERKKMRPD